MQAPQENSYNGGLIDFHESALRADLGAALYAHQLAAAQHPQYSVAPAAPQYPIQAHSHPHAHQAAPAGYAPPVQQYAFAQAPGTVPGVQSMMMAQAPSAAPQSMMMAQAQGQCIAGPPAFLHLHGKTYAPVEETQVSTSEPVPPRASLKEAVIPSGKNLDRMVEERIEKRVNEFFAKSNGKAKTLGASARKSKAPKEETCSLKQLNGQMRARLSAF